MERIRYDAFTQRYRFDKPIACTDKFIENNGKGKDFRGLINRLEGLRSQFEKGLIEFGYKIVLDPSFTGYNGIRKFGSARGEKSVDTLIEDLRKKYYQENPEKARRREEELKKLRKNATA